MSEQMQNSEKEYEMLRTEILQYMEEYQTVRNMMYVATVSILGLNGALWENYYVFLLPLIVIIPSYIVFLITGTVSFVRLCICRCFWKKMM